MLSYYKKTIFSVATLLFTSLFVHAQVIEGSIKDAKTGEPLPYVNVGIVGKGVGTVSNETGYFKLDLKSSTTDTLKLSMIGYKPQRFITGKFASGAAFALQPDVTELAEVKVKPKKWKTAILGNTTESKSSNAGFTSNKLGNEIGTIIKIKKSPTIIKRFNASIATQPSVPVKMRLNFYAVQNGMPGQILNGESIFVTVNPGDEKVSIDLEPYNLIVEDKFCITLEWIENSRGRGLYFSASLFKGPIIVRETSQAEWEKFGIVGLGFNVLVEY